ncbi:MAG: hypothetical protein IKT46_01360 [Clostridia bacterium]|nr:hypothetical protein [Clostridia bacterium]
MRKTGRIILFLSLGGFISCVAVFILSLTVFLNIQTQGVRADSFLASEPRHHFINTALNDLLSEGVYINERTDFTMSERYVSPEGIEFISKSKQWDKNDLELLYKELLQNKHGEELYLLSSVTVYPQRDDKAAATHKNAKQYCTVPISHTLVPEDLKITFTHTRGHITLYNGDNITTVAGMAEALSHEYGHHYTRYYMLNSNGDALYNTGYAVLRGLNAENSYADMSVSEDFYYKNHYKFILEIAAEDYVTLMGSPASREVADHMDIMEALYNSDNYVVEFSRSAAVQENLTLPMACEVQGLAEYFYSFIGEQAPEYDIKKDMNIRIQKRSQTFDLVGGYRTFVYYEIEFDKVYGEDATYVLTVYDPDDYAGTVQPVRTVTKDEKALCRIGNAVRNLGSRVIYNDDGLAKGTKVFIVNVITPDGKMYTSAPFSHTF